MFLTHPALDSPGESGYSYSIPPLLFSAAGREAAERRLSHLCRTTKIVSTNFYIDGFNLYYGSLKNRYRQYKWLDVQSLSEGLLPSSQVKRVRYFTAHVKNPPYDSDVERRQRTYLRALKTLPKVEIHYGHFSQRRVRMPLADPPSTGPATVEVIRTEEKRSDVNLATHLLLDACEEDFDEAVVITNDSDLADPIKAVHERFNLRIGVINPGTRKNQSYHLIRAANWTYATINLRHFRDNQLPIEITDATGTFHKPPSW